MNFCLKALHKLETGYIGAISRCTGLDGSTSSTPRTILMGRVTTNGQFRSSYLMLTSELGVMRESDGRYSSLSPPRDRLIPMKSKCDIFRIKFPHTRGFRKQWRSLLRRTGAKRECTWMVTGIQAAARDLHRVKYISKHFPVIISQRRVYKCIRSPCNIIPII